VQEKRGAEPLQKVALFSLTNTGVGILWENTQCTLLWTICT